MTFITFLLAIIIPICYLAGIFITKVYQPRLQFIVGMFALSLSIAFVVKFGAVAITGHDYEYHTGLVQRVVYKESYEETITTTDDKGNTQTTTIYHGPEYRVVDTNNYSVGINEKTYVRLAKQFGEPNPPTDWGVGNGWTHTYNWPINNATAEVVSTSHTFINRTQANHSVFKYDPVSEETKNQFQLFDHPKVDGYYTVRCVLGDAGPETSKYERQLSLTNAYLGHNCEIRIFVLVFHDQPIEASVHQEALWKGGKKNELVICFGVNNAYDVTWTKCFSWSNSEQLKADIQTIHRVGDKLDLFKLNNWLNEHIPTEWKRREFTEFKYIQIEPPAWSVFVGAFFMVVSVVSMSLLDLKYANVRFDLSRLRLRL